MRESFAVHTDRRDGFALVITIVLLALLVLVVYAVSALGRIGNDIAGSDGYQTQARQHALLGLSQAVAELQRYAADDNVLTGMAGVAGESEGAGASARHWCGIWDANARLIRWLASGASGETIPNLQGADAVLLAGNGSLGAEATDREYVRALAVPVVTMTPDRGPVKLGSYAWWVGDEGVKLSAVLSAERHAIDELTALAPAAPALPAVISYEQLALVPSAVTSTVLAGQLRANFHALTRTHAGVTASLPITGALNVNSTSLRYWRGVAATYNRLKPASAEPIAVPAFAAWLQGNLAAADASAGKAGNEPYRSADLFLNGDVLAAALDRSGGSVSDFNDVMRSWLVVRSDTFRVRTCGQAVNPSDSASVEAVAWVEAIVQRVKASPSDTRGRFVVIYFRWLGSDDI